MGMFFNVGDVVLDTRVKGHFHGRYIIEGKNRRGYSMRCLDCSGCNTYTLSRLDTHTFFIIDSVPSTVTQSNTKGGECK